MDIVSIAKFPLDLKCVGWKIRGNWDFLVTFIGRVPVLRNGVLQGMGYIIWEGVMRILNLLMHNLGSEHLQTLHQGGGAKNFDLYK